MIKIKYIFLLFSLLVPSLLVQAKETPFLVKINSEELVLESGGVAFTISQQNTEECIKIKDGPGIIPYYRYLGKERYIYIKGNSLKKSILLTSEKDKKEVKLIFQPESNFQLELNLTIQKDLPCLFIKASLKNISSEPQNIALEWFTNYNFSGYIASDLKKYEMPQSIGVDYTAGMPTKTNWTSIGLSRKDKCIYLLPDKKLKGGLGIVSKKPTEFGLRPDRFVYWGEMQGMVEEGDGFSCDFILVPVEKIEDFNNVVKKLLR